MTKVKRGCGRGELGAGPALGRRGCGGKGRPPGLIGMVRHSASLTAVCINLKDAQDLLSPGRTFHLVQVADVVGMSRDDILAASKARNTHSKRDRPPPPPAAAAAAAAAAGTTGSDGEQVASGPAAAGAARSRRGRAAELAAAAAAPTSESAKDEGEGSEGAAGEDDDDWQLRVSCRGPGENGRRVKESGLRVVRTRRSLARRGARYTPAGTTDDGWLMRLCGYAAVRGSLSACTVAFLFAPAASGSALSQDDWQLKAGLGAGGERGKESGLPVASPSGVKRAML